MKNKFQKLTQTLTLWMLAFVIGYAGINLNAAEQPLDEKVAENQDTALLDQQANKESLESLLQKMLQKGNMPHMQPLKSQNAAQEESSQSDLFIQQLKKTIMLKELEARSKMLDAEISMAEKIQKNNDPKIKPKDDKKVNSISESLGALKKGAGSVIEKALAYTVIVAFLYCVAYPFPVPRKLANKFIGGIYENSVALAKFCFADPNVSSATQSSNPLECPTIECPTCSSCDWYVVDHNSLPQPTFFNKWVMPVMSSKFLPPMVTAMGAGLWFAGKEVLKVKRYKKQWICGMIALASLYALQNFAIPALA